MAIFPHLGTLHERASGDAAADDVNSTTYRVQPNSADAETNATQAFEVVFDFTTSGGTSPTLDAKLEGSLDGTSWFDIGVSMTQMTSATTQVEEKAVVKVYPYMRVSIDAGGTAAPSWYGSVKLCSTAPFKLRT